MSQISKILILGSPEDAHAVHVFEALKARGGAPVYLDTRRFPHELGLDLRPGNPAESFFHDSVSEESFAFSEVQSVYWRTFMGIQTPNIPIDTIRSVVFEELNATLGSLLQSLPCRLINSYQAIYQHKYKPYQLQLLKAQNIRVPETLISNRPDSVLAFYEQLNGQMIYKPVFGGASTEQVTPQDLTPERLQELKEAPVQFQELIEGTDIRVYLVDDALFAAELHTQTLDFRDDPEISVHPIQLPASVEQDCRKLAKTLGLVFTGIDLRRTPEGEYVFFEGNPSPMFTYFEDKTGYPITDRLVDLLMEH